MEKIIVNEPCPESSNLPYLGEPFRTKKVGVPLDKEKRVLLMLEDIKYIIKEIETILRS